MDPTPQPPILPPTGVFSFLPDASVGELLARVGYGFVVIDMEHSPRDLDDVYHAVRAIKLGGAQAWIRVASLEASHVQAVCEIAPDGIVAPFVNDVETAREFVHVSSYAPRGGRGFCSLGRVGDYGMGDPRTAPARHHDLSMARIATVEHVDALAQVPDIVELDGIDGVLFGRADMTAAVSSDGADGADPAALVDRALQAALETPQWAAAVRRGVLGMLAYSAEEGLAWRSRGVGWLIAGADTTLLASAARETLASLDPRPGP